MKLLLLFLAVVYLSCNDNTKARNKTSENIDTLERISKEDREEFKKIKLVIDTGGR